RPSSSGNICLRRRDFDVRARRTPADVPKDSGRTPSTVPSALRSQPSPLSRPLRQSIRRGRYTGRMARKSGVEKAKCALCGAKDVSEPRGEERYCRDCWEKKIAVEEVVAREFALK